MAIELLFTMLIAVVEFLTISLATEEDAITFIVVIKLVIAFNVTSLFTNASIASELPAIAVNPSGWPIIVSTEIGLLSILLNFSWLSISLNQASKSLLLRTSFNTLGSKAASKSLTNPFNVESCFLPVLSIPAICSFFLVSSSDICESAEVFKLLKALVLSVSIASKDFSLVSVIADKELSLLVFRSLKCFVASLRSASSFSSVMFTISRTVLFPATDSNVLAR